MKIPQVNIDEFNKNGFSLIKNVLSPGEIEILRSEAYRTIEDDKKKGTFIKHRDATNHIGCLTNIEPFKKLILDDGCFSCQLKIEKYLVFYSVIVQVVSLCK